jgi:hypothetical protein
VAVDGFRTLPRCHALFHPIALPVPDDPLFMGDHRAQYTRFGWAVIEQEADGMTLSSTGQVGGGFEPGAPPVRGRAARRPPAGLPQRISSAGYPYQGFHTSSTFGNTGKGVADPVAAILRLLDRLADQQTDERCGHAAASIHAVTGSVPASGPKTRALGSGTVEVPQAIRSARTTSALAT